MSAEPVAAAAHAPKISAPIEASAPPPRKPRMPALLRSMRPRQWVKNAFVLAPLVFAGPELLQTGRFTGGLLAQALLAAAAFCMASSATYLLNDLHDLQADRQHPIKRLRPIAAGELSEQRAWTAFGVLLVVALGGAAALELSLAGIVGLYFAINVAYSKGLKRIAYVDAAVIASGFLLRLLAGGEATGVHLSAWLIACTVLLALFLALGKRKHELLTSDAGHRSALQSYKLEHLNFALGVLAAATCGAYLSYTLDPTTRARFHTDWLPYTTPLPVFGLLRFYGLLDNRETAASPTDRMLGDPPILVAAGLWAAVIAFLIYGARLGAAG